MISPMAFIGVFSIMVFLAGAAFGTLMLFVISIHRAGSRTPMYQVGAGKKGGISRSVLITTRIDRREDGK